MNTFYSKLVSLPILSRSKGSICEKKGTYSWLTERHIQALWWERAFFRDLCTQDGQPITVLSPGQWNANSGPDFRKAHLLIGSQEFRGDVEIHLTDDGWTQHHHDENSAYNQVVLHVSFWEPVDAKPLITQNGKEIQRVYLHDKLTITHEKIPQFIDIDLYPYKPYLGSGKCSSSVFNRLDQNQAENFFASASLWRLHKKGEHILTLAPTLKDAFGAALARALGFPANNLNFLSLYQKLLPLRQQGSPILFQALALGACGYFDTDNPSHWIKNPFYVHLKELFNKQQHLLPDKIQLSPQRTRPLHHPIRRIAALSYLLCDTSLEEKIEHAIYLWHSPLRAQKRKLWNVLSSLLPTYIDPYWNSHYFFEEKELTAFLPLIGEQIKKEMMINVLLPIIYVRSESENDKASELWQLIQNIQATKSGHANYLRNRFYGESIQGNIFKYAYTEQGAMQLHHDFCQYFETSCYGCPFIERFELNEQLLTK